MKFTIAVIGLFLALSACSKPDPYHWGHIAQGVGKIVGK